MPCSITPARMRASTCSRLRSSRITVSMPSRCKQVTERQAGRAGPDDADLRARPAHPFAVLVEDALGDRERAVGCGNAAVDGALEQDLLELVRGERRCAAPRERACASSCSRPVATSAVIVMQLRVRRSRPGRDQISPQA